MFKIRLFSFVTRTLFALVSATALASASVIVTPTGDATTLANTILGAGVTITNTPTFTGDADAAGTFTNGATAGIGISSGIILSSGAAASAVGPNASGSTTTNYGNAGDADLDALIGGVTHDAAVLSFEFMTDSGDLFFNYVFASEEYNEYVNSSFNDVFGLYVDGVNIALAPDSQVVAVNTVNCGNPYVGAGPNCAFFNNNDGGLFDIEYDGFTSVFTASITGLAPGSHVFKAAIADTSDFILDSAIFIQAGTFSSDPTSTVPEPSTLLLLGAGLLFAAKTAKRRAS